MRHLNSGRKLNRSSSHRKALLRNLATALIHHDRIRTTDAKAKELRRWGDRMITLGKAGSLHARRRAAAIIQRESVLKKLFDEIAPRYQARNGGYTRVIKLGIRHGDAAPVSLVELVERAGAAAEPKGKDKKKPRARAGKAKKAGGTEAPRRRAAAG